MPLEQSPNISNEEIFSVEMSTKRSKALAASEVKSELLGNFGDHRDTGTTRVVGSH